jgi:hypothetical protein
MKTLKIIAFSISVFLIAFSCKKDKNKVIVNGSVYDPNTLAYIEGVKVSFMASKLSGGTYNSGYVEIASAVSDAGGKFTFEVDEDKVSGYRFFISKPNYFHVIKDYTADQLNAGVQHDLSFNMYPEGFIKLDVTNVAPMDTNDFIAYSFTNGYVDCDQCCNNVIRHGKGMTYNEIWKCKTYGNQNVIVTYYVTKNYITNMYTKTFYCNAFDTASCIINY